MKTALPESLHEHIASLAKKNPAKVALVGTDEKGNVVEKLTYSDLLEKLHAAAAELRNLGLVKGDRIALAFRNSPALELLDFLERLAPFSLPELALHDPAPQAHRKEKK